MGNHQHALASRSREGKRDKGFLRGKTRIAYLSSAPGGRYHFEKWLMWRGISEAARDHQAHLIYLAGEEFEQAPQAVLYQLVGKHNVDGLIIWNTFISRASSLEKIQQFVNSYLPLPMVSIDLKLLGCANLLSDEVQGVRDLLTHLIRVHGLQKFAFVYEENSHFSDLRQSAFEQVTSQLGLYQPELVLSSDRLLSSPVDLIQKIDAIIAQSDDKAVQIIDALGHYGIRVPEDIVVTGFNDGLEARGSRPPLTTVRLPFRNLGRQAVDVLMRRLQGDTITKDTVLAPYLVLRRSCGCLEPMAEQAAVGKVEPLPGKIDQVLLTDRAALLEKLVPVMGTSVESLASEWAENLLSCIHAELQRYIQTSRDVDTPSRIFLQDLNELLRLAVAEGTNVTRWHEALTILRHHLLQSLNEGDKAFVEDMWQQARVLVGQVAVRAEVHRGWRSARRTEILREIESELLIKLEFNELLDVVTQGLSSLGIHNFYLVLYENEEFDGKGRARLALAYMNGERAKIEPDRQFFQVNRILPDWCLDFPQPVNLVVEALHLSSTQIGYIVFNTPPPDDPSECDVFQALRIQLSSALRGVKLRQRLQDARQQAEEANQLKSRFLSMVSHELRTPLNLIVGLSEMAMRQQDRNTKLSDSSEGSQEQKNDETHRKFLEQIYVSGQHLDRLIRDVLDLASSQVGQMSLILKPLDIKNVLDDVASMGEHLAQQKYLHFRMEVSEDLPRVMGDKTRLRQILLNLLSNAVKFTAHGEIVLSAVKDERDILISVRDTGLGIAKKDMDKIFDEFRQSDRSITRGYGGIGLGLAITRRLVEMHGGHIWVDSSGEEGSGSTFSFTLPILAEDSGYSLDVSDAFERSREGKVLILTGLDGQGKKLVNHLQQHGFQTEEMVMQDFSDSQQQEVIESLMAAPPGAVVLDLAPASEQGWDIMKHVKENPATQDIPVIFYSLMQGEDKGVVLEMDYLTKPVGVDDLVKALKRHGLNRSIKGQQRTILIIDDEPGIVEMHTHLIQSELPEVKVLTARNGNEGLHIMRHTVPNLVLLDLMMPELDGFGVLKAMQSEQLLRGIPVIVLSGQVLSRRDMERLNQGVAAVLSKGMFNQVEILNRIEDVLARSKRLGSETQKLVQQAMGFIHEHFKEPISRADIASSLSINEQYLSRCFNKEMGIGPMVYLSRYRIEQAKRLLESGSLSITQVAMEVGMSSQSYFSRVFQEETGVTPSAYQRGARKDED